MALALGSGVRDAGQQRERLRRRNLLIHQALDAGWTHQQIASEANFTESSVRRIAADLTAER